MKIEFYDKSSGNEVMFPDEFYVDCDGDVYKVSLPSGFGYVKERVDYIGWRAVE